MLKIKAKSFTNKPLRGYIKKKIIENEDADQKLTDQWSNNKYISCHFEAIAMKPLPHVPFMNRKSVQKIWYIE